MLAPKNSKLRTPRMRMSAVCVTVLLKHFKSTKPNANVYRQLISTQLNCRMWSRFNIWQQMRRAISASMLIPRLRSGVTVAGA